MARKKAGRFFAIDKRVFQQVMELGINPTVSYLVLACGTGADHKTTSWSAHAVFKKSGMSQSAAAEAIKLCREKRFLTKGGSRTRPQYKLSTYYELQARGNTVKTERQKAVYETILNGDQPINKDRSVAQSLVRQNLLLLTWSEELSCDVFGIPPQYAESEHLVWLPCELINGATDERPPIARLRRHRDPLLIQMLLDFYDMVDLRDHGGVPKSIVWKVHDREEIDKIGYMSIWAFERHSDGATVSRNDLSQKHIDFWNNDDGDKFWNRLQILEREGLVYWMPHLIEADDPDAEIMHPLQSGKGKNIEIELNRAAREAAEYLVENDGGDATTLRQGSGRSRYIVPVEKSFTDVQLVSVLRLRYQVGTEMNFGRYGEYLSDCEDWLAYYKQLAGKNFQVAAE